MPLKLIRSDITAMQIDAVVNPSNSRLRRSSGVCDAVFSHAGDAELKDACRRIGHCAVGDAVITPGFNLPANFVIHTAVPFWLGGKFSARKKLRSCYTRSLDLARKHGFYSIAFPLIRADFPSCPKLACSAKEAMAIALSAIGDWLMESDADMDVYLVLDDHDTCESSLQHDSRLQTFIDNQYIGDLFSETLYLPENVDDKPLFASDQEENILQIQAQLDAAFERIDKILADEESPSPCPSEENPFDIRLIDTSAHPPYSRDAVYEDFSSEDTLDFDLPTHESTPDAWDDDLYTENCFIDCSASDGFNSSFAPEDYGIEAEYYGTQTENSEASCEIIPMPHAARKHEPRRLENVLKQVDESFSEMLFRLIDQCGMSDPEVYKRANMDRRLFSKIRSNVNYQPAKSTVFALAIALRLNLDQTTDLLCRAGFAFSPSSKSDIIIKYFIREGIFNIHEINEALFSYDQKLLGA